MPILTRAVSVILLFVLTIPHESFGQQKGTSSIEYYKMLDKMTPEERKEYRERLRRNLSSRKPNVERIKSNLQRRLDKKKKRHEQFVEQTKIQKENQALAEKQYEANRLHYETVIKPQQQKEAELRYQKIKDIAEYQQREEMIQLQRQRNWMIQDRNFYQGYLPRRIYYGVQPYGIDLRYP